MKQQIYLLTTLLLLNVASGCAKNPVEEDNPGNVPYIEVSVIDYGVVGDDENDDTGAIQKAIDDCARGSGKVIIPEGRYIVSTLFLKSDVELHLQENAELVAVNDYQYYVDKFYPDILGEYDATSIVYAPAMLFANNASDIKVTGQGVLDGTGSGSTFPKENNYKGRPRLISFMNCKDVLVEDITLKNSAAWVQHYLMCDGVTIRGIKVYSFSNYNNDGIDIDSRNVLVENCYIESDDDGICLKSDLPSVCENVIVRNCTIKSNCNAIKLGTSSYGGFKNVEISDCRISAAPESPIYDWQERYDWAGINSGTTGLAGIAVECVDGGLLEDIVISDIEMDGIQTPVFIRLGDRSRKYSGEISRLQSVTIRNVEAVAASRIACSITGVAGGDPGIVRDVLLENISIEIPGGGQASDSGQDVPENRDTYPENRMFGTVLPGAGFYVRHAENITFDNVSISSSVPDTRPYYYFDDASGISLVESVPADADAGTFIMQKDSDITVDGILYEDGKIDGELPEPDNDDWIECGENRYLTCLYGDLRWMVTNSKEGTPLETTYEGREPGENGYYYDTENKATACPEGWRLPTWDEALDLKSMVESEPQSERAGYWLDAGSGAFAGQKGNTWSNWGLEGVWRLADRESDGREVCVIHTKSDGTFLVEDGTTKTPRGFSVRCVKEEGQSADPDADPDLGQIQSGDNTYVTYYYESTGLEWMVENSREGTPLETTYEGREPGENGYYYDPDNKTTACPEGWRLPTWDEALSLKDVIDADRTAENVRYWTSAESGAFAGQKGNTWSNWGLEGMWRLADYEGSKVCVMHSKSSDGSFTVEAGTTKTPRGFSVRCVRERR